MNSQKSKSGRTITAPSFLGKASNPSMYASDSEPDVFGDDSIEDPNYTLPMTPESDHDHIVDSDENSLKTGPTPKKRKIERNNVDFNDEFEAILSSGANEHVLSKAPKATALETAAKHHDADDLKMDGRMISKLYKNSIEILARITVIEKTLIKNQMLHLEKTEPHTEFKLKVEQLNTFLISNELPLKSIDQTKKFEANLTNETFKKYAVSIYICVLYCYIALLIVV